MHKHNNKERGKKNWTKVFILVHYMQELHPVAQSH